MARSRTPTDPRKKGERTRAHLVRTAFDLFEKKGFEKTTLRDIASRADVSLGLLYRYYPSKDALVIELYEELAREFERRATFPEGTWLIRYVAALRLSIDVLRPHREALRGMLSSLVVPPGHPLFIPGDQPSHERVRSKFVDVVAGSTTPPPNAERLGRGLYLAHLGLVLGFLLDRSPNQKATFEALDLLELWAPFAGPWLDFGAAAGLTDNVSRLLERAVLGKTSEEALHDVRSQASKGSASPSRRRPPRARRR
jgi:AcrR family transcriptional regulator